MGAGIPQPVKRVGRKYGVIRKDWGGGKSRVSEREGLETMMLIFASFHLEGETASNGI